MLVNPYIPPRTARQPGTSATLANLNSRFVNASLQKVNALWQIHTIGNGGYVTSKFYLIDLVQKNVAWTDWFFASQTSDDFNASITANPAGQRLSRGRRQMPRPAFRPKRDLSVPVSWDRPPSLGKPPIPARHSTEPRVYSAGATIPP